MGKGPFVSTTLNLSNYAQIWKHWDLGISPNASDSKLASWAQRYSANAPIRRQRTSNETSASVVYFLSNPAQTGQRGDLGISLNTSDSKPPIRAQRASNETSALVVYFPIKWSNAAHSGFPSGPILRTLYQARTLSDLIHSEPRMRSYTDSGSIIVFYIRI